MKEIQLKERNIIRIYTNNFNESDVLFLSNVIKENLNIENKMIIDSMNQFIIIIEKENINKVRDILLTYMHTSMYYKLGINL